MTSLSSILNIASTGLQTSQTALSVVSDNVANVNTTGYVRKTVNQTSLSAGAAGAGVTVADVQRVTNSFLETAGYAANASSSSASAISGTMDQAQTLFGDPSASGSLFANLDSVFSSFSTLAANPSPTGNAQAVSQVSQFFNQATSIATSIQGLSTQTDANINTDIGTVNQLLTQINSLNATISRASASGVDITGPQNQQSELITQLSSLINVQIAPAASGGVNVVASDGTSLVGTEGAVTLAYAPSGPTGGFTITNPTGVTTGFNGKITSGEVGGLLQLRNVDLPALSSQLGSLTTGVANQLNAVHNQYSAVPPPTSLTGQSTGIDLPTAISGFSGKTTIALVNPSNETLDHSVSIDFDAQTITVDGGSPASFNSSNFLSTLNSAMASTGATATYTNGSLSLASNSSDGIAIQDDSTTPATNAGKGFSQFFGLNNLVSSNTITDYDTGLSALDSSGYPAGQSITLRLSDPNGNKIQDVTVTTPGGDMADLMGALNAPGTGVGAYGSFSLDGNGDLTFAPNGTGASLSVVADSTANGESGVSMSTLFGIGAATRSTAATTFSIRSDISQNPNNLAVATLNLSAAASGAPVLAPGDATGADALGQAGLATMNFDALNGVPASTSTLSNYAANISSVIANKVATADNNKNMATTVASNASTQLSSVEGVSIDQEMINLTTFQQAYNASARMVQAANDLYTTLLGMVQ
jgi:flagellar hook-associated protein 1 FlgK